MSNLLHFHKCIFINTYNYQCRCQIITTLWGVWGAEPPGRKKYYPQIKSYYQSEKYSHLEGGCFKTFFQNGHFEGGVSLVIPTDSLTLSENIVIQNRAQTFHFEASMFGNFQNVSGFARFR